MEGLLVPPCGLLDGPRTEPQWQPRSLVTQDPRTRGQRSLFQCNHGPKKHKRPAQARSAVPIGNRPHSSQIPFARGSPVIVRGDGQPVEGMGEGGRLARCTANLALCGEEGSEEEAKTWSDQGKKAPWRYRRLAPRSPHWGSEGARSLHGGRGGG